MDNETSRVAERFQPLFDNGMTDIKFFVPKGGASLSELLQEAADIQEVVAAGRVRVIDSVDATIARTPFDAPF